jgi:hypothetical protein
MPHKIVIDGKFGKQDCAKTLPSLYSRVPRRRTPCICIPKGPYRGKNKQQRWNYRLWEWHMILRNGKSCELSEQDEKS